MCMFAYVFMYCTTYLIYLYIYLGLCNINLKEDRHGVRMLNDNNFSKRYVRIDLCVCVAQSCQTLCDPMDCSSPEMPMACSREPTSHLPLHPISQDCLSAPALSALFHASNLDG